jgi:hypothetical protein
MYCLALKIGRMPHGIRLFAASFVGRIAGTFIRISKLVGIGSTMVNFPGRNDRRRRILKEEVLAASSARASNRSGDRDDTNNNAPRYTDAAGVENHPQITDFVPRRYSTIAMLGLFGIAASAATAALHYFVLPIAAARGLQSAAAIDLAGRSNVAAWLSAIVLFMGSAFCVLTYSLRRHRIDDYRGRYRVWLSAALACLMLSANSVIGLHQALADSLSQVTGWSILQGGAIWWAVAGLPLAWIFVRVLLDVRECRIAAATMIGAGVCYGVSAASYFDYGPAVEPGIRPILVAAPLLLGHWLAFTAIVANARFVVLDAQGLVKVRRRTQAKPKRAASAPAAKSAAPKAAQPVAASSTASPTVPISRATIQTAKTPADSSRWVDGSRFEREDYDDEDEDSSDGDRKLSKSERKRLRKIKAQGRAA